MAGITPSKMGEFFQWRDLFSFKNHYNMLFFNPLQSGTRIGL